MKLFLLFLICVLYTVHCTVTKEEINQKWRSFKRKYGKSYGRVSDERFRGLSEHHFRKRIFTSTVLLIKEHNERYKKGLESYKLKINRFADKTAKELKHYTHGLDMSLKVPRGTTRIMAKSRKSIPLSVDWRTKGVVTPVKNQKNCGSCWAFAANGVLESHIKIAKGANHKISASEQELVDCSKKNRGCAGGMVPAAYLYVKNNGIASESQYPYIAKDGTCRKKQASVATIKGFGEMSKANDELLLAEIVANKGPVAVAINADDPKLVHYESGIFYNPNCSKKLGHAVMIVGYGTENGKDYWIVKNSWGTDWGDKGYIKMARNKNNHCGIATIAHFPIL